MSNIKIVNGNLLDATEEYIAHQCNCITTKSKHLAKQIFDKFPYANTYKKRTRDKNTHNIPATIEIMANPQNKHMHIINMYAQYYPGASKYINDSKQLRLEWFKQCLNMIGDKDIKHLAMPFRIGSGSARGDWNEYLKLIIQFTIKYDCCVTLYKLEVVDD